MKTVKANFILDALAFVAFAALASTGCILAFLLPSGSGRVVGEGSGPGSAGKTVSLLWGFTRHEWGAIHLWAAFVFLGIIALHLFLHWRWIVCMVRGQPTDRSGSRFGLALSALLLIAALAASPFFAPVEKAARGELQQRRGIAAEQPLRIQGRMTLREAAAAAGVTTEELKRRLDLPGPVSDEERIGRLGRTYGFTAEEARAKAAGK